MDDERAQRNETRAEQWAERFRREVDRAPAQPPRLMRPPPVDMVYSTQMLSFTLYRRLDGLHLQEGNGERRVEFPDGSGYLTVVGSNVNLNRVRIHVEGAEYGWDINVGQKTQAPSADTPESPSKKPKS